MSPTTARTEPGSRRSGAGTKGVARPEREAQIVDAGCRVFGEKGYAAASVADVAAVAGISKPLIYTYFGSKDGLYVACLHHAARLVTEEIDRTAHAGAVGVARGLLTLDGMFRLLEPQPWIWRVIFDPTAPRDGAASAELTAYEEQIFRYGREGVSELMRLAGSDDPADTAAMHAVWENVFRTLVTWWLDNPGDTPEQMTERCVRLFTTFLGPIDLSATPLA